MSDDSLMAHAALDGFASATARSAAHQPIVDLVDSLVGATTGAAIDLGCGSGALLEQLSFRCSGLLPVGIELDPTRAAAAKERLASRGGDVIVADLQDVEQWPRGPAVIALVMPGRLIEAGETHAAKVIEALRAKAQHIVAYAYGDWLSRYGDLDGLALAAGLQLAPPLTDDATGYPRWRSCAPAFVDGPRDGSCT